MQAKHAAITEINGGEVSATITSWRGSMHNRKQHDIKNVAKFAARFHLAFFPNPVFATR